MVRVSGWAAPDPIDWAIAAGCFAAFTVPVLLSGGSAHPPGTEAAFGAMAAAPLIVRRKWPVAVVLVVTAVFTAADRSRRPWSLAAAGVAGAATWASLPVAIHLHPHHDQDAVQLIAVIAAWLAGDMVRAIRG
jgi:hypothetical protein